MYYLASIGPIDIGRVCFSNDRFGGKHFLACVDAVGDGHNKPVDSLEEGKEFVASFFHADVRPHIVWTSVPNLPLGARAETARRS